MANQWYTKKWVAVSLHILFWALWFAFPYLLRPVSDNNGPVHAKAITNGFYNLNFANNLIRLMFFYVNAYLFIPLQVYKKRYWEYLLALLTTLGVMLAWDSFFFHMFLRGLNYKVWNFFVFNLPRLERLGGRRIERNRKARRALEQAEKNQLRRTAQCARLRQREQRIGQPAGLVQHHELAGDHIGAGTLILLQRRERGRIRAALGRALDQARSITETRLGARSGRGDMKLLREAATLAAGNVLCHVDGSQRKLVRTSSRPGARCAALDHVTRWTM